MSGYEDETTQDRLDRLSGTLCRPYTRLDRDQAHALAVERGHDLWGCTFCSWVHVGPQLTVEDLHDLAWAARALKGHTPALPGDHGENLTG